MEPKQSEISERWLIVAETGIVLMIVALFGIYIVGTQNGSIVENLLAVGGLLVLIPLTYAITVGAIWQDMMTLQQAGQNIQNLLWVSLAGILPVIGGVAYVATYSRKPINRGLIGRLLGDDTSKSPPANTSGDGEPQTDGDDHPDEQSDIDTEAPTLGEGAGNRPPEFEIRDVISQGGDQQVALVYLPAHSRLAIQKSRSQAETLSQSQLHQLAAEGEIWASIDDHPNIVDVWGYGTLPEPWIIVEYLEEGTLDSRKQDVSIDQGASIIECICDGLYHGHERGIYHLDIKPANILFEELPDTVKITDWGSAIEFTSANSPDEFTPAYTAPELLPMTPNIEPSPRPDIFQVGILAYELLTGVHPFRKETTEKTMEAIRNETPTPPSDLNSDLSQAVDKPVFKALEKKPEDRYEIIKDFSSDLNSAIQ